MSQLEAIADRRREGGFPARELMRDDREWAACFAHRKHHELRAGNKEQDYADFACRHPAEGGCVVARLGPAQMERIVRREERRRKSRADLRRRDWSHNASVLEAFQSSDQSLNLTSFNSLASSATAGWSSTYVDNSSNLYLDLLAYVKIAAVNTAPANNKAFYVFGASMHLTTAAPTDLPTTGASSGNTVANSASTAAALTFPSIATPLPCLLPTVRVIPYPVQNVTNTSPLFSLGRAFGGWIGLFNWWAVLNYSGMTIAASGNLFSYRGVYSTVA